MPKKIIILDPKSGYNLTADYYARREKYWDSFEKGRVLPLLGEVKDKKILDVGAGTGRLALRLAKLGAEVTALDVSEEMLKHLKPLRHELRPNAKTQNLITAIGEAEDLPFEDESFDVVIATFLIVHLKDLNKFFDEVYRVLKPALRLGSPRHELGPNAGQAGIFLLTNINQRQAPAVKTKEGLVEIESYYHRPEAVIEELEKLAFSIEHNEFVREGDVWVNQVVVCRK